MTTEALEKLPRAGNLYEAEMEVVSALLEMSEGELAERTPEEEAAIQHRVNEALQYAQDKRESFGLFLLALEHQQTIAKAEIERLKKRAEHMESLSERLRRFAIGAILALGPNDKGKYRTLMGRTISMFIRALPVSVDIRNEEAVPLEHKTVTVRMPATLWERLCATSPALATARVTAVDISRESVRKAIEAGQDVPGADLRMKGHDYTLVVK